MDITNTDTDATATDVVSVPTNTAVTITASAECLTVLAAQVRTEHEAAESALRRGVYHAMACGDLLIVAKEQLAALHGTSRGRWLPWLKTTGVPERWAQRYMRLARHRAQIEKSDTVSDLNLSKALRLLAKPDKPEIAPWTGTAIDVLATLRAELIALTEIVRGHWPDAPDSVVMDLRARRYQTGVWPLASDIIAMKLAAEAAASLPPEPISESDTAIAAVVPPMPPPPVTDSPLVKTPIVLEENIKTPTGTVMPPAKPEPETTSGANPIAAAWAAASTFERREFVQTHQHKIEWELERDDAPERSSEVLH